MALVEKVPGRIFEILNRLDKVESDLKLALDRSDANEFLLHLLIESISIVEVAMRDETVTNLFYELVNKWADKPGPSRGVAMYARILADTLNAKSNVTSKRRRSKKR